MIASDCQILDNTWLSTVFTFIMAYSRTYIGAFEHIFSPTTFVIQLVFKFNFSVCRLVKTVSCTGSQNVMFTACFGEGATDPQ